MRSTTALWLTSLALWTTPTMCLACDQAAAARELVKPLQSGLLSANPAMNAGVIIATVDERKWNDSAAEVKVGLAKTIACTLANTEVSDIAFIGRTDNRILAIQKNGSLNLLR